MSGTELNGALAEYGQLVDDFLEGRLHGDYELYRAARHLPDAGGKRMRPTLLLLVSEMLGGDVDTAVPAAAAVEATHTFTLIDDDLPAMDNDDTRRGVASVHQEYGEDIAVLSSDLLQTKAFEFLTALDTDPARIQTCTQLLTLAMTEICEGQVEDMQFEGATDVDKADYERMAAKKTGGLYGTATQMGAVLSPCSKDDEQTMRQFGRDLGLAFQMVDDVLDFTSDEIGKEMYSDLRNGKTTIVTLLGEQEGVYLSEYPVERDEGVEQYIDALRANGVVDDAENHARRLLDSAVKWLDRIEPANEEARETIESLVKAVVRRSY